MAILTTLVTTRLTLLDIPGGITTARVDDARTRNVKVLTAWGVRSGGIGLWGTRSFAADALN